jgi:hypothetical protein
MLHPPPPHPASHPTAISHKPLALTLVVSTIQIAETRFWDITKGHLDVVRGPSTPHDPESDAGGSLSSRPTQAGKVKDEGRS